MAGKRKETDKGGTPEKLSFVENRRAKAESKAALARRLTADQIKVEDIQLDVPEQGRVSLRPGGRSANSWDEDVTEGDNKADRDSTDQFFDMDSRDFINDMDACDRLRLPGGGGPVVA